MSKSKQEDISVNIAKMVLSEDMNFFSHMLLIVWFRNYMMT